MTIEELKELQNQIIEKEKKYNLIGGITYLALIIPSIIMMIIWKSDYFSIIIFPSSTFNKRVSPFFTL